MSYPHKSGSMYEYAHSYEPLLMAPKAIILSHAMSFHLDKRCTHVKIYYHVMLDTHILYFHDVNKQILQK